MVLIQNNQHDIPNNPWPPELTCFLTPATTMRNILLILVTSAGIFFAEPLKFSGAFYIEDSAAPVGELLMRKHHDKVVFLPCPDLGQTVIFWSDPISGELHADTLLITSDLEPAVSKTDSGWEIRFLPTE